MIIVLTEKLSKTETELKKEINNQIAKVHEHVNKS